MAGYRSRRNNPFSKIYILCLLKNFNSLYFSNFAFFPIFSIPFSFTILKIHIANYILASYILCLKYILIILLNSNANSIKSIIKEI